MSEKKIEPTEAMVEAGASYAWEETNPGILGWNSISERHKEGCRRDARAILRTALNHPDARGLFADEDDRPWEPLNGPVRVGDEVRQELRNLTITAVVARVGADGDLWAAEDEFIGRLNIGTWYVRRPVQEMPTEDGAVIVPADGREHIEAVFDSRTWRAKEAILCASGWWRGVWRREPGYGGATGIVPPECITPGTWKVEGE